MEKRAYSIDEFAESFGISKSLVYQEMKAGKLEYASVGKRRLIPMESSERWLKSKTSPEGLKAAHL